MIRLADSPPGLPGSRYYDGMQPAEDMFGLSYLGAPDDGKMEALKNAAIPAGFVAVAGYAMHRFLPKKAKTLQGAGQVMVGVSLAGLALSVYQIYLQKQG